MITIEAMFSSANAWNKNKNHPRQPHNRYSIVNVMLWYFLQNFACGVLRGALCKTALWYCCIFQYNKVVEKDLCCSKTVKSVKKSLD